jgi:spore coat polysaccharide biosynthesis protein SpsF
MSVAVVVQARMTSTRLPGKVLMDLGGAPVVERMLARLRRLEHADEIVLAVTTNAADDPLVDLARRLDVRWFRGSEEDVLGRYVGAAREVDADLVVRVTSDCPLIDPTETDRVIAALAAHHTTHDYANNFRERVLPRGLETEAMFRDALERAGRMATSPGAREHVTPFIHRERADLFEVLHVAPGFEAPGMRWTVDQVQDLEAVRALWEVAGMSENPYMSGAELAVIAREHPEIGAINAGVRQKPDVEA